jgi:hypothetical protein
MGRISPHIPISSSSRRRLARLLVGSPICEVERDLILETLTHTHGNRTVSARLLGVSVRTLRNKITEYSAEGLDIPHHESRYDILNGNGRMSMTKENKTAEQLSDAAARDV